MSIVTVIVNRTPPSVARRSPLLHASVVRSVCDVTTMAGEGLRPRHPPRVAHLLTQGRGECPCSANDKAVAALIPPLASVTRAVVPVDEVLMMFLQRSFRAQRSVLVGFVCLFVLLWLVSLFVF